MLLSGYLFFDQLSSAIIPSLDHAGDSSHAEINFSIANFYRNIVAYPLLLSGWLDCVYGT